MLQNQEDKQHNPMLKFKTTVCEFDKEVASPHISNYIDKCIHGDRTAFSELLNCKIYIERMGLKEYWWERYIKVQQKLKDIALLSEELPDRENEKEAALYDWLKICINPEKNPNYDFYFEKEGLDHEKQVKEILFTKEGLRNIFKNPDWQIRLKKIRMWFIARYDVRTAYKLQKNLVGKKRFPLNLISLILSPLVPIRLICAILIGFIPLVFESEVWRLALRLSWADIFLISGVSVALIFYYLTYECHKITRGEKSALSLFKRIMPTLIIGMLSSLLFSTIFYEMFFYHFINSENGICKAFQYIAIGPFQWTFRPKIIIFFATIAFLIGILIQVIWEEKTVTEPL